MSSWLHPQCERKQSLQDLSMGIDRSRGRRAVRGRQGKRMGYVCERRLTWYTVSSSEMFFSVRADDFASVTETIVEFEGD